MRNFSIVVGVNNLNGIAYKGKLPWKIMQICLLNH